MSDPLSPKALEFLEELNERFADLTGGDLLAELPAHEAAGVLFAVSTNVGVVAMFALRSGLQEEGASYREMVRASARLLRSWPERVAAQAAKVDAELEKGGRDRV